MQQQVVDNRYRILRPLGAGGMAEVYLAHDDVLDRDVALKVMSGRYADDEEFIERFRREAQAAAALSHPNIVSIYDRGEDESGTYYIAMEYLPGGTLKDRILKRGALPPRTAAAVALQIAEALQAAHRAGVVHRDIKPHNVLITASGDVKVGDFGIARAASSSTMTRTGSILGTAHYISPEQAMGEPVGPRSDLYSLGVVLYEMLTGKLPFDAETPIGIAMKHVNGYLSEPREANPEIPEGINAVTMRLLAKDPDERYASASDLIEDLERILDGLAPATANGASRTAKTRVAPVGAAGAAGRAATAPTRTSPPPRRAGDGRRRKRAWLPLLALLLLVALVAGVAYAISQRDPGVPLVEVPDLTGATSLEEARSIAGDDFRVVRGDSVESREPPGSIAAQDPEPGEEAERGSRIRVDVVETRVTDLPDVTGRSADEARQILEGAGFLVEVERRESSEPEEGFVLDQDPPGGEGETAAVEPDAETITLTVGSGPATAQVPDLSGLGEDQAEDVLEEAGFRLGEVSEQPNDTVPEGQIFEQNPQAGVEVREGGTVNVVVSTGPELFPVPDVTGSSLAEAQATLEQAGFVLGSRTEEFSDDVEQGDIISQDPGAGEEFEAGTAVSVVVSAGPEEIVVPNVIGQDWIAAAETLQAEGLRVYQEARTAPSNEPENTVLSTDPAPGTEVEPGTAVRLTVSSGPPDQPDGGSGGGSGGSGGGSGSGGSNSGGGSSGSGGGVSGGNGSSNSGGDGLADNIIQGVTGEED